MTTAIADGCALTDDPTPVVVCLGGIDIVAAEPLRRAGRVVVAPGGLRWLADHREA
jgi:ligand-binding SRPBCC domain-containing protein